MGELTNTEGDQLVLDHLRKLGAIKREPAAIVDKPPVNPFCVIASNRIVLNPNAVQKFRHFFEQIAEFHHGDYDGWEAASKP